MESIAKAAPGPDRDSMMVADARGNTLICAAPDSDEVPAKPRTPASLTYLIVVRGGIPGTMFGLPKGACSLGRSAENTVQLHEGTVSRRHATIMNDPSGTSFLTDVGSTNGTFVDGHRLLANRPAPIPDGTRIQL